MSLAPQDEPVTRPRAFQIYDSLAARAVAESARDHMLAQRWPEALVDLQRLLEEHRGEVLGATRPKADGARNPSQGDVHLGASHWAERQLFALPREARALYRERHESRALGALQRALALGDRGGLSAVARRWPLTDASQRAWWALGDLEVERGELEDGLRAWAHGAVLWLGEPERTVSGPDEWRGLRDALRAQGETRGPAAAGLLTGALARVHFALSTFSGEGALDAAEANPIASFVDGTARTALIDPDGFGSEGWPREWRTPNGGGANPFVDERAYMRVFGARDASAVYVNTSRAVHAIGAFSGETLWSFGPDELGWDRVPVEAPRTFRSNADTSLAEFSEALDSVDHIVAPAVARGVVVAALQLPIAYEKRDQFNRIEIIDVIPERRLVGLDARTGARLWDGLPPPNWDGDTGTLAQRMTVVGPPTIVGARVLALIARQRGRIELHVGCFDLATGAVLWSTPVVTGQVPLNMFGRQVREFSAPPLVVQGGKVIAQTNLGVIAALDLFTGDTLWETIYEQIPIQAPTYYQEGELRSRWRNAPPALVGGTVVSTPVDCPDLIALDLATGALRWSIGHRNLLNRVAQPSIATEVLLGADEDRVYLLAEGRIVLALRSPEGVERSAPTRIDWQSPDRDRSSWRNVDLALPALDARYVYFPGLSSLTIIERATGRLVREIPGDLGSGNLLVSNGALVAVSAENTTAAFEWRGMVSRAEAALRAAPDDPRPVAELARLYLVRAEVLADTGDAAEAARLFKSANRTLIAHGADEDAASSTLRQPLFRSYLGEARLARRSLDSGAAEERLRAALRIAPDADHRREALLALQAVQRGRPANASSGFVETLGVLAAEHSATGLSVTFKPEPRWAPGGLGGVSPDPWEGALVPDEARFAGAQRQGGADGGLLESAGARARTSLGLWVALELLAEERRRGDAGAQAERLFDLLRRFGDEPLPGGGGLDLRTWAAGRLGLLRATAPASIFAGFEADGQRLLAELLAAGEPSALARVAELYPGTEAARRANDLRLDSAVSAGEVEEVARIVLDPLPADSTIEKLDERDLRLVLRLAAALGTRGNAALAAALAERIAAARPDLIVDLAPYRGVAVPTLADQWRAAATPVPHPPPTVTTSVETSDRIDGDFAFLGAHVDAHGEELALFLSDSALIALRPGERSGQRWETPLVSDLAWAERRERAHISAGRVHVAARDRVVCVRAADGRGGWTWSAGDGRYLLGCTHSDGVVLARTQPEFADGSELLVALDAASGIELWRRATPYGTAPVAGGGRLVLHLKNSERAEVIDLFLGGRLRTLEVGTRREITGGEGWITDGLFVLPQFLRDDDPRRNHIEAWDLDTGARAWRIDLQSHRGAPHVLMSVLEYAPEGAEPRRLLVLRKSDATANLRTVHVLNERLGALDRAAFVDLRDRADFIDLARSGLVRLTSPLFFIATAPAAEGDRTALRAVDVRLGTLWDTALPRSMSQTDQMRLFAPVVAEDTVVLATVASTRVRRSGESTWELNFFDRRTGDLRETRPLLPKEFVRWHELVGVGSALFLAGNDRLDRMESPR